MTAKKTRRRRSSPCPPATLSLAARLLLAAGEVTVGKSKRTPAVLYLELDCCRLKGSGTMKETKPVVGLDSLSSRGQSML